MMKYYLCRDCRRVHKKDGKCEICDTPLESVEISRGLEGSVPFILAGLAALILLFSFLSSRFLLIWLTFPLTGAGLLYDHIYQKQVEEALEKSIKKQI